MMNRKSFHAFTLIELLVVIGIVGLVAALLLPGIQAVRESARAASCAANLRQLGIATLNYVSTFSVYPNGSNIWSPSLGHMSPQARLLPYLELNETYEQINMSLYPNETAAGIALAGLKHSRITIFLCPSDERTSDPQFHCNYRNNIGSLGTFQASQRAADEPEGMEGPHQEYRSVRPADITDGLSRTAYMSERLVGDADEGIFSPQRDFIYPLKGQGVDGFARSAEFFRTFCPVLASKRNEFRTDSCFGVSWLSGGVRSTWYNHVMTPNSSIPDCTRDGSSFGLDGAVSARSNHRGFVQVLLCDGSVRAVSWNIGLQPWIALGSRAGGERDEP